MTIEPRLGGDYWFLSITIERPLGPLLPQKENVLERKELTLDEFEIEFVDAAPKRITVRLSCETTAATRHFDRWLTETRGRHTLEAHARQLLQIARKRVACHCAR